MDLLEYGRSYNIPDLTERARGREGERELEGERERENWKERERIGRRENWKEREENVEKWRIRKISSKISSDEGIPFSVNKKSSSERQNKTCKQVTYFESSGRHSYFLLSYFILLSFSLFLSYFIPLSRILHFLLENITPSVPCESVRFITYAHRKQLIPYAMVSIENTYVTSSSFDTFCFRISCSVSS